MGLLSRSSKIQEGNVLDEMGEALKERLRKLPVKKDTPYTALSLLKAYAVFQSGICLKLNKGIYSSYTSVGIGVENISINKESIKSGKGQKYFKLDNGKNLGIKSDKGDIVYWVFPLDSLGKNIMILGARDPSFNPVIVSAIIEDVADKMLMEPDKKNPEPQAEIISEDSDSVQAKIAHFYEIYNTLNCIIFENNGEEDFCRKVQDIVDRTGTVIPLSSGNPLILFRGTVDRELIAHRLSKSLNARLLLSFEAESPENVFERISDV